LDVREQKSESGGGTLAEKETGEVLKNEDSRVGAIKLSDER